MKVQVKEKAYNTQAPNTVPTCKSPLIESDNLDQMGTRVDICLGTNTNYASPELLQEYNDIKKKNTEKLLISTLLKEPMISSRTAYLLANTDFLMVYQSVNIMNMATRTLTNS
jgi:hypothetical protein